ncbi:agmatinase [Caballeronia choica]|uniref:Agmatinase n=1 Tax=Caballeronia choica TaxID=326476 RepID=A0A158KVZ0_9BURK|nr:agmatinase [Caballeronia choica]
MQVEECWCKSITPIMDEVRTKLGKVPVYLTFDIDGLDPSFAPGTGTPEIGGLMIWQALEIIRGLPWAGYRGLRPCGDSPPYDPPGNTAVVGANLLYERLCAAEG